eukprot:gene4143-2985_t
MTETLRQGKDQKEKVQHIVSFMLMVVILVWLCEQFLFASHNMSCYNVCTRAQPWF